MTRFLALFLFICLSPFVALAQLNDLPDDSNGNGYFEDPITGYVWMDVSNFFGMTYDQVNSFLGGTNYRLATKAEVQTMLANAGSDISDLDPTDGVTVPTLCCRQLMAWYDDNATGSDSTKGGITTVFKNLTSGPTTTSHDDDDQDQSTYSDSSLGAWAIEGGNFSKYSYDFDGDGKDDSVVWRASTGTFYVRYSASSGYRAQQWGLPGDYPFFGDYDGDLIPDFVVWRPAYGMWYVLGSDSGFDVSSATATQFGLYGDRPIRGDFDGDDRLDLAVWRPSTGMLYYLSSHDGSLNSHQWGLPGDIPMGAGSGS